MLQLIAVSLISFSLGGLLVFWITHRHHHREYLRGHTDGFRALIKRN